MTSSFLARRTIPALLSEAATRFGDRQALVVSDGQSLTYRSLAARIERLASWLAARGVKAGSSILLRADNGLTPVDAYLSAARLGAACVPIPAGLSRTEVEHRIAETDPVLGLADEQGSELLASTSLEVISSDSGEYRRALNTTVAALPQPDGEDIALVIYTSGTSGRSKGVCLSQSAVVCNAAVTARSQEFGNFEVYLSATPMYHATAAIRTFTMLFGAHTHVVMRGFDPETWLRAVETFAVTHGVLVPTQVSRLLDHPAFDPSRAASLRLLVYGAGPSSNDQIWRMSEELPCGLYHGYGLTEAATLVTGFTASDHAALSSPEDPRLGSCGTPIPGVEVVLRDSCGAPVAAGEVGEITLRSPKVMSRYMRDHAATEAAFRDGWLLTGDLAVADSEGYLKLAGRSKEVIISGGVNVYPAQVEGVITAHPEVVDAAVFAVGDSEWGESVAAAVQVRAGSTLAGDDVRRLVAERLESRASPRWVSFVEDFPRTSTGKIRKAELLGLLDCEGGMQSNSSRKR